MKCNVCQVKFISGLELRVKGLLCTRNPIVARAQMYLAYKLGCKTLFQFALLLPRASCAAGPAAAWGKQNRF